MTRTHEGKAARVRDNEQQDGYAIMFGFVAFFGIAGAATIASLSTTSLHAYAPWAASAVLMSVSVMFLLSYWIEHRSLVFRFFMSFSLGFTGRYPREMALLYGALFAIGSLGQVFDRRLWIH